MNGFIGTALSNYLHERGNECIGLQRETLINYNELLDQFTFHKPDYIVHLAAYGNHSFQQDPQLIYKVNIGNMFRMIEASRWIDYKKFYNISSSSVTLSIQTFYSSSKAAAENIVNIYRDALNKPIVNVRPYSVYGPGEAPFRFIPKIIYCLLRGSQMVVDKNATHDWIYIDDFIKAMLAGETEIGTGIKTSNKEIVQILEDISGKKLNYVPGKFREYDNDNWVAAKGVEHISLYDGLQKTFNHYANEK